VAGTKGEGGKEATMLVPTDCEALFVGGNGEHIPYVKFTLESLAAE